MQTQRISTDATATTVATQGVPPNANRLKLTLANTGCVPLELSLNQAAVVGGLNDKLGAFQTMELNLEEDGDEVTQAIWIRVQSGLCNVTIIETVPAQS